MVISKQNKKRSSLKSSQFSVQFVVISFKKKKKRSTLKLRRLDYPALGIFHYANLPERHEIAQNFDAILPKKYEIAQNLTQNRPKYMKLPKILPEIWTPYTNRGGGGGGGGRAVPPTSYAYERQAVAETCCCGIFCFLWV